MKKELANRIVVSSILLFLAFSLLITPATAQGDLLDNSANAIKQLANSFSDPLKNFTQNTELFVRTLFFLLVLIIVQAITTVIPLFSDKKTLGFLFALIVSILAVFFIPSNLVLGILNPYTALGVALLSIVPFIIMFVFTQHMLTNTFLKKVTWLFFAVVLLALTVGSVYNATSADDATFANAAYSWVYGVISVIAVAMIFFNQWIDKHIWAGKMEGIISKAEEKMQKRIALDKLKEEEFDAST